MASLSPPPYTTSVTKTDMLTSTWSKWFSDIYSKLQRTEYTLLDSIDLAGLNSVEFTTQVTSFYSSYKIELVDVISTTENEQIKFRVSTTAGETWDTRAAGYSWLQNLKDVTGTAVTSTDTGNSADSAIAITGADISHDSTATLGSTILVLNPSKTSSYKHIQYKTVYMDSDERLQVIEGSGLSNQTAAINGFQLYCATNTISSGKALLYGRF